MRHAYATVLASSSTVQPIQDNITMCNGATTKMQTGLTKVAITVAGIAFIKPAKSPTIVFSHSSALALRNKAEHHQIIFRQVHVLFI